MATHVGRMELVRHHLKAAARQLGPVRFIALCVEHDDAYGIHFVDELDRGEQRELLIELACAMLLAAVADPPPEST